MGMVSKMVNAMVRRDGQSVQLSISPKDAKSLHLKKNEMVRIEIIGPAPKIKIENPLKEMFGAGGFSRPTAEILAKHRRNASKYL